MSPRPSPTESAQLELGLRLRAARDKAGWTQKDLSEASGVHPQMIWRIENGRAGVTVPTLLALARALRLDLNKLFRGVDWPLQASNYSG